MPDTSNTDAFAILLANSAKTVADDLQDILNTQRAAGVPDMLLEAMSYALLNGGKRLRPLLVQETAALFGRRDKGVSLVGAALECVHSYSLVHDDLPAMDDDDLRRGKPTTHKQYDEATAILVGDGLQALAFELICQEIVHSDPSVRLAIMSDLSRASGGAGMVGGQWLDLAAEGRFPGMVPPAGEAHIQQLQAMKTGALLRFACVAGARLADANQADFETMARFGAVIGLAFQLADDVLDRTSDAATLGKATGKDADAGKATLVDLWGLERAQAHLGLLVEQADSLLSGYGDKADTLRRLAAFIAKRQR